MFKPATVVNEVTRLVCNATGFPCVPVMTPFVMEAIAELPACYSVEAYAAHAANEYSAWCQPDFNNVIAFA